MAEQLTIGVEDARRMCAEPYETVRAAGKAAEQLRAAGYQVTPVTGERVRVDGRAIRLVEVHHPDVDVMPEPVGEVVFLPPQVPGQRKAHEPGS